MKNRSLKLLILISLSILTVPFCFGTDFSTDQSIQDAARIGLCGEYTCEGGIYEKFVFGDKDKVVVHLSGLEVAETYFVIGDVVYIHTDKAYLEAVVLDSDTLEGKNGWIAGDQFVRATEPAAPCLSFVEMSAKEKKELAGRLCSFEAVGLQAEGKMGEATEAYLNCCRGGDAYSCNKYGFMKFMLEQDEQTGKRYFRKACDMDYGGGCTNLADMANQSGQRAEAKALYEEACQKGFRKGCLEAAMME